VRVITAVGAFDPALGRKAPIYVLEDAHGRRFATGTTLTASCLSTSIRANLEAIPRSRQTHYALSGLFGATTAVDQFTLTKPRGDKPA